MRVIVAGPRGITDPALVAAAIAESGFEVTYLVSGGADGVDSLAIQWARERRVGCAVYRPDWRAHGRAAGPIRNALMAENADALVAIWDGESRGTADMIRKAKAAGLPVHTYLVAP